MIVGNALGRHHGMGRIHEVGIIRGRRRRLLRLHVVGDGRPNMNDTNPNTTASLIQTPLVHQPGELPRHVDAHD